MQACAGARRAASPGAWRAADWASLVQLGDSNVGKSSLVLRFVKNQFTIEQCTTVGAAFLQQVVPLDDSDDKIQFGIWDTAGSERYKALAPMVSPSTENYCSPELDPSVPIGSLVTCCHSLVVPQYYRGAEAAIVVYDITSFVSVPHGVMSPFDRSCVPAWWRVGIV